MRCPLRILLFFFLTMLSWSLSAQESSFDNITEKLSDYKKKVIHEKVFVHTDRTFYITGDYLWFSVYNVDAAGHRLLDMSKVVYIEMVDKNNKPVLQSKIAMRQGRGSGSIFLPATLSSGNYRLRAYTRWMQNFDPSFYFYKTIAVVNPFKPLEPSDQKNAALLDVQFFPEGGNLVEGLESKIAFRVVNSAGNGINFNGIVLESTGDTIAHFTPLKFGIGHFLFKPEPGAQYRVVLYDSLHHLIGTSKLPLALKQGYVMRLSEEGDQLNIAVMTNKQPDGAAISMLVHTRQSVRLKETKNLDGSIVSFRLDKNLLGDGISHITIFENGHPVCERLYFNRPAGTVSVTASTGKKVYSARKKVRVNISLKGFDTQSRHAQMSASVFRLDTLQPSRDLDITSYLLLTSDLQGAVESPGYYFNEGDEVHAATDNLMLTHGWRRFVWKDVVDFDSSGFAFIPELRGQIIQGKVRHKETNDPAVGKLVYLSVPGKRFHFRGARSNRQGDVFFELPGFYGSGNLVIQPNFLEDSLCKVVINTPFSDRHAEFSLPPFTLSPEFEKAIVTRSINMQLQNAFFNETIHKVSQPKVDSTLFYGKPDQQFFLDDYTRFPVMEEVMREYVPGVMVRKRKDDFYFLVYNENDNTVYRTNPLVLLDGVPVFDINKIMAYDPLKVQRLDVITNRYFYGPMSFQGVVSYSTYLGNLPEFDLDSRAISMSYDGLQLEREFFAPVYESGQQDSRLPDFRDLLFWDPNLKTDSAGNCTLDFYTSDQAGKYVVVVQGVTTDGLPLSGSCSFAVTTLESN